MDPFLANMEVFLNKLYLLSSEKSANWNTFVDFNNKYGVENEYSKR